MSERTMLWFCPTCQKQREFIRVIEAHVETEDLAHHKYAPIGPMSLKQWVAKTEQPLAYCVDCKTVIFIGPSAEEVDKKFAENNK